VEARRRLSDLMAKLEGNEKLDGPLQDVLANTDSLTKIGEEAGVKKEEDKK
jgi:type VI secretion system protein ImpB